MLNYLYYKLFQATLKGSLRELSHIIAPIYTGGLIGINFLVIYIFLVKLNVLPYVFTDSKQGSWVLAFFVFLAIIYFRKNKREAILRKYKEEGDQVRIRGNFVVGAYVLISFLLIFAAGLFRIGKL